ncbi:MAG: excinuclease ABC subunit C [Gammaproteobacteria bacterium]|nr:MAG: excinuclease ABC subunit C [Gammaproteobacteria bacterium]
MLGLEYAPKLAIIFDQIADADVKSGHFHGLVSSLEFVKVADSRASRPRGKTISAVSFDAQQFLKTVSRSPGVYQMKNDAGETLYAGKAKNLHNRLQSYFRPSGMAPKTAAMMRHVTAIETTVTHTENEALLLESNLIKSLRPKYNILLRDDKSYPYILLTSDEFPRFVLYRGARKKEGRYFGPFPSAGAAHEFLNHVIRVFSLRQCEDSYFKHRSRPCLQYQIERCTAPCVGLIERSRYLEDVRQAELFLEGKSHTLINDLVKKMEQASAGLAFEQAAVLRDRIARLRRVQEKQYIESAHGNMDVIAVAMEEQKACVHLTSFRQGRNFGGRSWFPRLDLAQSPAQLMAAFLKQHYLEHPPPREVLVSIEPEDRALIETMLSERSDYAVRIKHRVKSDRAHWLRMAKTNANDALRLQLASQEALDNRYDALQTALGLESPPARIECFDISHTQGEETVASCVVFDRNGARKSDYRRFRIRNIQAGDDYAAMQQVLERRLKRVESGELNIPDILLIDGGKGQVAAVSEIVAAMDVPLTRIIGISKGPERRAGMEKLVLPDRSEPVILGPDSPALLLLMQVRDEAHRFAITGHRQARAKKRSTSPLEGITGIGPKKRQMLLKSFGGLQEVKRAGIDDLASVPGINRTLAQKIYDELHG